MLPYHSLYIHSILRKKGEPSIICQVIKDREFKAISVQVQEVLDMNDRSELNQLCLEKGFETLNTLELAEGKLWIRTDYSPLYVDHVSYEGPEEYFYKEDSQISDDIRNLCTNPSITGLILEGRTLSWNISPRACCLKYMKDHKLEYPSSWGEPDDCNELYIINE